MPDVDEFVREHVTVGVNCADGHYLNGFVPHLQSEGAS